MVKWLFFDLGSTLIDESDCDEFRILHFLSQHGAPDRGELIQTMQQLVSENRHPYKDAAKLFGLHTTDWPTHLEKLYPGIPELLERLNTRYKLGIIANQNPGAIQRLEAFGIRKYFRVIATSAELKIAKPCPEIFCHALHEANCIAAEAVMIGDRLDNDIVPAFKIGMKTVWVRQGLFKNAEPTKLNVRPDRILNRITDIEM